MSPNLKALRILQAVLVVATAITTALATRLALDEHIVLWVAFVVPAGELLVISWLANELAERERRS